MIRKKTKLVREGKYAAEVPVDLIEEEGDWSPYLSVDDAQKLDAVRLALRQGGYRGRGETRPRVRADAGLCLSGV
jgi:hypothetical protein